MNTMTFEKFKGLKGIEKLQALDRLFKKELKLVEKEDDSVDFLNNMFNGFK